MESVCIEMKNTMLNPFIVLAKLLTRPKALRLKIREYSHLWQTLRYILILLTILTIRTLRIRGLSQVYVIRTLWGDIFLIPMLDALEMFYHIYCGQDYDKLIAPSKGSVVLDVGAHYGFYTIRCVRHYGVARVVAIEPHPENFLVLRLNCSLNKLQNRCSLIEAAAGSSEGVVLVYIRVSIMALSRGGRV